MNLYSQGLTVYLRLLLTDKEEEQWDLDSLYMSLKSV